MEWRIEYLDLIEFPDKIKKLTESNDTIVSDLAKLCLLMDDYVDINEKWLEGMNETEPKKKYLQFTKEWIITGYKVSRKVYVVESS